METNPNELPSVSTSLLNQIQQMQPAAWSRLVEVFSPIVYRWARQSGLAESDSADVVQEVFIAIARNVTSFQRQKKQASFRSWLATISRNRIRDQYRNLDRHPRGAGGTTAYQQFQNEPQSEPVDHSRLSDQQLDQVISLESLDQRIPIRILQIVKADCDPRTWDAFWQTAVIGDRATDVAARLEMNIANVYQAKSRILQRIRRKIAELP